MKELRTSRTTLFSRWMAAMLVAFAVACLPGAAWADGGESDAALPVQQTLAVESEDANSEGAIDETGGASGADSASDASDAGDASNGDGTGDGEDAADGNDASDGDNTSPEANDSDEETDSGEGDTADLPLLEFEDAALSESGTIANSIAEETPQIAELKSAPLDKDSDSLAAPTHDELDRATAREGNEDRKAPASDASITPSNSSSWHVAEIGQAAASLASAPSWSSESREEAKPTLTPTQQPASRSHASGSNSGQEPFALPEEAAKRIGKNTHNSDAQAILIDEEPSAPSWAGSIRLQEKTDPPRKAYGPTRCRSPSRA